MATAKLTLIGLYNYDSTLFDGISLPEYFDKDTLVNTILLAGGEFGTLYPDPDFMKQAITLWSAKNQRYFERLAILMQKDYDPLENYNRREHWTDTGESENENRTTNTANGTTSAQLNNTTSSQFNNTTSGTDSSTTENKVSAYNSSAYENRDKSTTSGTDSETDTGTSSGSTTETRSGSATETGSGTSNGSSNYEVNRDGYARGNVGVMSSQDMFRQEMALVGVSPYDVIAGDFINEFCIKLYV